ncbi:BEL1-like homeodomain protein 1 [Salvia hispanica]|uniref:BEL1-like homeodomain protein 1 n=1 Tax=Salvia hispanica TaxID=49212 RepID=UPI002009BF55|nr:BEL1-like homeodomain protein 1 [Salvia hispanica]XP_047977867.1 BEL1-like homeodomain protein 1 [Salvia hispanica]XP_047977868.1 BEL1-like homeodomain protein 1 [Salvia hispanica]
MATYYHGNSEIQAGGGGDGLQTLILMNPAYVGYSDNPQPSSNFVFLNSNPSSLHHAPPPPQQHFVGVPLNTTTTVAATTSAPAQDHFLPRVPYNLYNLPMEARDVTRAAPQGLSLSLSSQQPQYASFTSREVPSQPLVTAVSSPPRCDDVRVSGGSPSSASGVSNGVQSVLLSSKYLKAAQEILDEVVNVGKGGKAAAAESSKPAKSSGDSAAASGDGQSGGDSSAKRGAELSTAERQEIQMKKAKLVNMLDEVEQRYRQYHQQMQMVISWFEQAAGMGSAKTYTALALETISKQFRCLKDAILGQIRGASKSLGEEESLEGKMEGSRLKYVDNQIRQQRALQQLGMIQHNAWRPQRGLPERSVSVLRAWLFEHFLHPYPKDSDKLMLAKQTGLTRSQVSNWFINARVRLWKPMVEEMYMEEIKEQDKANGTSEDKADQEKSQQHNNNISTSPTATAMVAGGFNLSEIDSITQGASPKKQRMADTDTKPPPDVDSDAMTIKFGDRQGRDGTGFTLMGAPTNFIGGFGSYPMGELGRFGAEQFQTTPYSGNGVSLTLGLPHCDNISMSGAHQSFLPNNQSMQLGRGVEMGEANDFVGMNAAAAAANGNVYDNINIQNRKRFAAQLLPDFVA